MRRERTYASTSNFLTPLIPLVFQEYAFYGIKIYWSAPQFS
jgi:hypothetical protein